MEKPKKVVVCGGGVVGVCTAYFLSMTGASVTLVERSSIAGAASGKAGGFLALDWCDGGPLEHLARASFDLHRSLADELHGAASYGYRPMAALSVTFTEADQSRYHRKEILPQWVDGPGRRVEEIGSTNTTAQVHPQLFTRTLLDKAVKSYGVEVVKAKVERVSVEGGRFHSVVLSGREALEADAVVFALGPWSGKFSILTDLCNVYGLKAHSVVLEAREGRPEITPHALFLNYYPEGGQPIEAEVYPRPTGEVYLCGMSTREEVPEGAEEVTAETDAIRMLRRIAGTVSSQLREEEAIVKVEQACFLPATDDGRPVIGELPGIAGCYVATGHNCWGILNGPATGAAVAELVMNGRSSIVDLSPFSPSRFKNT